jgi:DNA-binding protein Fis
MARWREKDRRRKQKEKDKIREKAFKERVKRSMEEVGIELESTEVEDSEEFVILDNENKDLHKISEKQKEMKRS